MMLKARMLSTFLAALAGTGANATEPGMAMIPPGCEPTVSDSEVARRAFFFAFPVYEMWRTRQRMLSRPGARINRLIHRTTLSQPADRSITMPNVDTLYSTAWLDLADGPVHFTIPAMGPRSHSVELMHAFSDAFAILRNAGKDTRHFLIVGPGWQGTASPREAIIRSPTRDVWLVARTFLAGAGDLAEAQRLQGAYTIAGKAYGLGKADSAIPARPTGKAFLAVVNAALARGPLPPQLAERVGCLGRALPLPGEAGPTLQIDPAMGAALDRDLDSLFDETRRVFEASGSLRKGWRYPQPNIADFGSDDVYRSAIALGGLAALPVSEAINPLTVQDADGEPLTGSSRYRISIPGDVPVEAFWSLTLYESDGAGRWFLYENPLDRHALNNMANGIAPAANGSIVLDISHRQPEGAANWLPAPQGRFLLLFRAYRPGSAFGDGSFQLPAAERIDD